MPPYANPAADPRFILRPKALKGIRRFGEPETVENQPVLQAEPYAGPRVPMTAPPRPMDEVPRPYAPADAFSVPPERDVTLPDPAALPTPQANGVAGALDVAPPVANTIPNRPSALPTPTPEQGYLAQHTRRGVGGRIKDFLETLLYSGGNPIAAGVAAASPGKLAQWKYNMIEQPRQNQRAEMESRREALKQQGVLRAAQARKAQGDVEEDAATRADRLGLIKANTQRAQAEAVKALRPTADKQFNNGAWHQERTGEWVFNKPGQPSFHSGSFGRLPPEPTPPSEGGTETSADIFGYPEGSQTPQQWAQQKQEAMTALDSEVARGALDPGAATAMKAEYDQHHPQPRPVKIGEKKAKVTNRPVAGGGTMNDKIRKYATAKGISEAQARAAFAAEGFH